MRRVKWCPARGTRRDFLPTSSPIAQHEHHVAGDAWVLDALRIICLFPFQCTLMIRVRAANRRVARLVLAVEPPSGEHAAGCKSGQQRKEAKQLKT